MAMRSLLGEAFAKRQSISRLGGPDRAFVFSSGGVDFSF